jgi:major membrane immunogen (membrane-anchored lipoprotein)
MATQQQKDKAIAAASAAEDRKDARAQQAKEDRAEDREAAKSLADKNVKAQEPSKAETVEEFTRRQNANYPA